MPLSVAQHVHLAVLGDDVVLLDVAADTYLCIPDGRAQLRPSEGGAAVLPIDSEVLGELVAAGLVCTASAPIRRRVPARPMDDIGPPGEATPSVLEVIRLCASLWDLAWRYRGRPFGEVLAFAARAPACAADRHAEIIRLARLFHRLAIWLPMSRKCLVRSFVLLRFLQRSGLNAQWVIGVRTWPFSAHCWLQLDGVALDDAWERLVVYEPILAVG
jgi:hypothetical protein